MRRGGERSTFRLGHSAWSRRHGAVVIASLALLPVIAVVGVLTSSPLGELGSRILVVALFLVLGAAERISENLRSYLGAAGALVSATALIAVSQGNMVSHFIFPFALALVTLYRRTGPFILGVLYMVVYYGAIGWRAPDLIFDTRSLSVDPHLLIVAVVASSLATSAAGITSWLLDTDAARDATTLSTALAAAALRQRQATELHDTVIQALALARYALEAGEQELALASVDSALKDTKDLVGGLLTIEGADLSILVTRQEPAVIDLNQTHKRTEGDV